MEPDELDRELEELETRVERLRALYEQYFLGIEKVEPSVPRKDVDRRIWRLRREQIRNTGKRFRLQTIIQRYNTFQQYWMRVCREIEAGTYLRHVVRAKKILANANPRTIVARKRHRAAQRALERLDQLAEGEPVAQNLGQAAEGVERSLREGTQTERQESNGPELGSIEILLAHPGDGSRNTRLGSKRPARPRPPAASDLGELDLEFDAIGGKLQPSVPPTKVGAGVPAPVTPPPPLPQAVDVPKQQNLAAPQIRRAVGAATERAGSPPLGRGPAPPPRAAQPAAPPRPPRERSPSEDVPPAAQRGVQGRRSPADDLSEEGVRTLHSRLLEAKRRTNDPTTITVESLRKSLESAAAKLRSKHGAHRSVAFEVVVKEGKALVKPVVK